MRRSLQHHGGEGELGGLSGGSEPVEHGLEVGLKRAAVRAGM